MKMGEEVYERSAPATSGSSSSQCLLPLCAMCPPTNSFVERPETGLEPAVERRQLRGDLSLRDHEAPCPVWVGPPLRSGWFGSPMRPDNMVSRDDFRETVQDLPRRQAAGARIPAIHVW